ncbi:AraC family ligand binding domain-containing protein [Microbulbifer sp. ZKSA004]|uniref:AraC family ligand binding domain-containing protein n=1 Tax=unclassified Microbulbifer TaxID=2619833 RepID=UPI00403A7331
MEFVELCSVNGVSRFQKRKIDSPQREPLGNYSIPYPAKQVQFREFSEGQRFDWHCAPQAQFILYLEGRVKLTTSSGEQYIFAPGDILLANDLHGEGHISESLSPGRAAIVVLNDSP